MRFTDLRFVPLGGVGEIGVNAYLYGQDGRWLMVDLGIGFADDRLPGVDIVLPDLRFIEEQRAFLDGLVLTHAHEDHLGAVPYLWPRLGCPIWCTPFTAAVLRAKLAETDFARDVPIRIVEPGQAFKVGRHRLPLRPRHPLDPRCQRPGARHRRSAACCTRATGSSTRHLWSAPAPTSTRSRRWARRACWPSCATAPTCCRPAPRAPRPRCATA